MAASCDTTGSDTSPLGTPEMRQMNEAAQRPGHRRSIDIAGSRRISIRVDAANRHSPATPGPLNFADGDCGDIADAAHLAGARRIRVRRDARWRQQDQSKTS